LQVALCTCAVNSTEIADLGMSKAEPPIVIGGGSGGIALVYSVKILSQDFEAERTLFRARRLDQGA